MDFNGRRCVICDGSSLFQAGNTLDNPSTCEMMGSMLFSETLIPEPFPAPERLQSWTRSRFSSVRQPVATPKLQLDEEIRQIGIKLRAAEYRDAFDFVPRFAARPDDLLQALLEHKPEIVHFSGHGSAAQQLIFVDDRATKSR